MHKDGDELDLEWTRHSEGREKTSVYHLYGGHVLFPPKEATHVRAHCRETIVDIHDDVHETVDERKESAVTT